MAGTTSLAGHQVGRMGYGLMMLTWTPQPPPQETSFAAMKGAADSGCTAWSTACFYGPPDDPMANVKLIAAFFQKYPEYKEKVHIILKSGIDKKLTPQNDRNTGADTDSIDFYRKEVKEALDILGDKRIDVFSLARVSPDVEVEEPYRHVKTLLDEGLFDAVGVSELSAKSLDKVSKVVDIACIEIEVSLWSYEQDIKDVIAWSTEHKVPILAYSPLGRGFITRTYKSPDDIPDGLFIKHSPRFQGEAFYQNLKLVDELDKIAEKKGVSTSELALAWVIGLSEYTIPIPGSSKAERVKSNAKAAEIKLNEDDLKEVNRILSSFKPVGGRYPKQAEAALMR